MLPLPLMGLCVVLAMVVLGLAMLPGEIAKRRNHAQAGMVGSIALWGILLPPLWVAALIWAMFGERDSVTVGAGYFDVVGVDAEGKDARVTIGAASPANAKVKAEQRGLTVTDVFAAQ